MEQKKNKIWYIIAILLLVLIIIIVIWLLFKNGKNTVPSTSQSSTKKQTVVLKDCQSNANSSLEKIADIKTSLFFTKLTEYRIYSTEVSPQPLSLKDYIDEEKTHPTSWTGKPPLATTLKNDIILLIEKDNKSTLVGYAGYLQLCDVNNKSNLPFPPTKFKPTPGAVNMQYYIYGGYEPASPGIYRVDGYLYTPDGKWHLVNRLENVRFIE